MKILKYITLARSYLQNTTKKLLLNIYNENFEEMFELLNTICKEKIPEEKDIIDEYKRSILQQCSFITIEDDFYPKLLKLIDNAPILLTLKGDKNILLNNNIAVVGSRKLEENDVRIISDVVKIINGNGFSVISGLAYGSDITAHLQSIQNGTIAVMPCGLSTCYPKDHNIFIDKIIDFQGCVLSEYCFNEPPKQQNFIQRNRIIVGISDAIFIARARDVKSGSISSAMFAKKFNRNIYTMLFSGENKGNKYLLDNNLAKKIDEYEGFNYDLIRNVAENQLLLEKICNNFENKCSVKLNTLFSKDIEVNITKEIKNIIKYSKMKVIEKNLLQLFEVCRQELKTNDKEILNCLLKEIFYKKS